MSRKYGTGTEELSSYKREYRREDSGGSRRTYPGSFMLSATDADRGESPVRSKSPIRGKSPVRSLSTKEEFIYREVKELRRRVTELEGKLSVTEPAIHGTAKPGEICFSAVRTSFLQAPSAGTVVSYDRVLTNKGGHFSGATGTFRCPQPGMYMFAMHAENACEAATFDLMVDNKPVASVTQGGENWSTSGNTVILPLATGQQVHVYLHQGKMSSYPDKPIASFCGFLVN